MEAKQWVTVLASPSFGNAPIGRVPLTDIEKPAGRVVETTLYDILKQDPQHYSFKLYFQIDRVDGRHRVHGPEGARVLQGVPPKPDQEGLIDV